MAAVLACGRDAILSHHSAAAIWGLVPTPGATEPVDVTIQGGRRRPGSGIAVHRVAPLRPDEMMEREGLPITAPARTLLDLASCGSAREVERALARAERNELVTLDRVERLVRRHPRRRGAPRLRALLSDQHQPKLTRSEAEAVFLELIRTAGLRQPETNVVVGAHEVDFLWRREGLVVEVDGQAFHRSRRAFEGDRRRDAVLTSQGLRVVRVTWHQLDREPTATVVRVAQALMQGVRRYPPPTPPSAPPPGRSGRPATPERRRRVPRS
ncbi:MAG: DUF559 domain-containing protein [Longimicrobiales bacterium]|nr:DUF559 domain-containing protein [Longimicrobiales bacterium]